MDKKNEVLVETKDDEGNDIKLIVKRPGHRIMQEALVAYNGHMAKLIREGNVVQEPLMLRAELDEHMRSRGIWSSEEDKRFADITIEIRALELLLQRGGIKLSQGREIALRMRGLREEILVLFNKRNQLDSITIEAVAEICKFAFLMTKCVLTENKTVYFANVEDCLDRGESQAAIESSIVLSSMVYNTDTPSAALYENEWLKDYDYLNKDGKLTDRKGRLVDSEGKLIDKDGRFIDENGKFVDIKGNPVNQEGDFIVDSNPFIDDDTGKPIKLKTKAKSKKRKRKTRVS